MGRLAGMVLSSLLHTGAAGALVLLGAGIQADGPAVPLFGPAVDDNPCFFDVSSPVLPEGPSFERVCPAPAFFEVAEAPDGFEPERAVAEVGAVEPPPFAAARPAPAFDRPAPTALRLPARRGAAVEEEAVELRNPPPEYPPSARSRRLQGEVLVEITISPEGRCGGARVVRSEGGPLFVEAVLDSLKGWAYRPAVRDGQPVESRQLLRFVFKLAS